MALVWVSRERAIILREGGWTRKVLVGQRPVDRRAGPSWRYVSMAGWRVQAPLGTGGRRHAGCVRKRLGYATSTGFGLVPNAEACAGMALGFVMLPLSDKVFETYVGRLRWEMARQGPLGQFSGFPLMQLSARLPGLTRPNAPSGSARLSPRPYRPQTPAPLGA